MRLLSILITAVVFASCGGRVAVQKSASTTGPPLEVDPTEPVAVVRGSTPGTSLGLISLERSGPAVITAKVRLSAARDAAEPEATIGLNPYHPLNAVDQMRLIDEVNRREHFPLEDANGSCLCSVFGGLPPGSSIDLYAKFPAPPPDVERVSLHVPTFPSFDGVRIGTA